MFESHLIDIIGTRMISNDHINARPYKKNFKNDLLANNRIPPKSNRLGFESFDA